MGAIEIGLRHEARKTIEKQELEIKKQRTFYGERMKLVNKQIDDAEKARTELISDLAVNENLRKELTARVKELEEKKMNSESIEEIKKELRYWNEEAGALRNKVKSLEKIIKDWEKHSMIFWKTDPVHIFKSNVDHTKEDRERFIKNLEELINELRLEANFLPQEEEMEDSAISTLTESRVLEDLSTTGGLGDNEGMDTTQGHADPEAMDTTLEQRVPEPKIQRVDGRKKRRMESTQNDKDKTLEGDKGTTQKPSKGREEIKPLETAGNNTEKKAPHQEPGI